MNSELTQLIHFALLTGFASCAMQRDVTTFTIPNRLTGSMAVTGVFSMLFLGPAPTSPLVPITLAAAVLLGGWFLFALGMWGAGDAKLMAAATLWISLPAFSVFVLGVVIAGAMLALASLTVGLAKARRAVPGGRWRPRLIMRRISMPYGLAIGSAAICTLAWQLSTTQ
jgi:prepilin peptidase CpaA